MYNILRSFSNLTLCNHLLTCMSIDKEGIGLAIQITMKSMPMSNPGKITVGLITWINLILGIQANIANY